MPKGHDLLSPKGEFLAKRTISDLKHVGFQPDFNEAESYFWAFESMENMAEFCKLLFGLDKASNDTVLQGIEKYLGIKKIGANFCIPWELMFIAGAKI